jgi:hypothetical protein
MNAKALVVSPSAIFSPAIATPPAECQAVEQRGSPFTPSIRPGVWTFSSNSLGMGCGSYNLTLSLFRVFSRAMGKSASRAPTVK